MNDTPETSRVHAFIDGVLLGLSISALGRDETMGRFIEVVRDSDESLAEFATRQMQGILKAREDDIASTFEVIYYTV